MAKDGAKVQVSVAVTSAAVETAAVDVLVAPEAKQVELKFGSIAEVAQVEATRAHVVPEAVMLLKSCLSL